LVPDNGDLVEEQKQYIIELQKEISTKKKENETIMGQFERLNYEIGILKNANELNL
jgi:hypothetical protein